LSNDVSIGAERLDLAALRRLSAGAPITLASEAVPRIERSAATIANILQSGRTVYGINTGFGVLARQSIAPEKLDELQRRIVLSHSVGVGPLLPDKTVRLVMALKIVGLSRGFSGVGLEVIAALLRFVELGIMPCIPSKGSVGASGSIADGRWQCADRGKNHSRGAGFATKRFAAFGARPKGRPCVAQWHPGFHGAGVIRPVPRRNHF